MIRTILLFLVPAAAIAVAVYFSFDRSAPAPNTATTTATETEPERSQWSDLSAAEEALGFRKIVDEARGTTMIVHPNSPCWLELPTVAEEEAMNAAAPQPGSQEYIGPSACAECHRQNFEGFQTTAHATTSAIASPNTIAGSFSSDSKNSLETVHPHLRFEMIRSDDKLIQQVHFKDLRREIPMDIVTGSGNIAQTFLFWNGDQLYQSHVSYFRESDSWINSPGYHDGTAWYSREVIPKCVQCHTTYMEWVPGSSNQYVPEASLLGVSCERCHGPGHAHVEFHRDNPDARTAHAITNPQKLSRSQSIDVCGQCHHGQALPLQAPFTFRPGDRVEDHFDIAKDDDAPDDVHTANQSQRMVLSQCYLESQELTCTTCHNPHAREAGLALYSSKCIKCHASVQTPTHDLVTGELNENCIDCHMSTNFDQHIRLESQGQLLMPLLRDHNIRILKEATDEFLQNQGQDTPAS